MEKIGVEMVAQDAAFIASSKQAAAAVNQIAAAEAKLAVAAKELGVDGKKFSQEFARVEKQRVAQQSRAEKQTAQERKQTEKAATSAQKKADADERKRATAQERAEKQAAKTADQKAKKRATETKKAEQDAKKATAKQEAASKEQVKDATALAARMGVVAGTISAGAVAAGLLVKQLATAALDAVELRENARGFFNVLTAGRGTRELENVDRLAGQLGIKFNDARQQFVEFRQAGLDNRQSAKLIKLAADLNTVDRSGELARQAIQRVLSYTSPNGLQTPEQLVAADRAMALLAKQAHVTGKGVESAAASTTTLVGALNRIDNVKTSTLETLGERTKPSIDKAASAVATFVEKLSRSKEGQKTLDNIVLGIGKVADAVTKLAEADPDSVISQIGEGFKIAESSGREVVAIFRDVGIAFKEVASAAYEIPYAFYRTGKDMYTIGSYILKSVVNLPANFKQFVIDPIANAGPQIIDGLVKGLDDGADRAIKAVGDLASRMKTAFKRALGINSPSRVFEGYGVNIGAGTQRGLVASMPTGSEIAAMMKPPANDNAQRWGKQARAQQSEAMQVAPGTANGNAARASGGHNFAPIFDGEKLEINVTVQHGTPTADIDTQVIAILENWWARKMAQRGAA